MGLGLALSSSSPLEKYNNSQPQYFGGMHLFDSRQITMTYSNTQLYVVDDLGSYRCRYDALQGLYISSSDRTLETCHIYDHTAPTRQLELDHFGQGVYPPPKL